MQEIVPAVEREALLAELTPDRLLRLTNKGDNELYVVDAHTSPNVMREVGRLREIAFRDSGGGAGKDCDIDEFDTMSPPCRQLVVWDPRRREVLGGYRYILGPDIRMLPDGTPRIATSHMFRFSPEFLADYLPRTVELGRSFVAVDYQSSRPGAKALFTLDNLWDGLGAITVLHPEIDYLFGKMTMYPSFGATTRDLLLGFLYMHFPDPDRLVAPLRPLECNALAPAVQSVFTGNFKEDYRELTRRLRAEGKNIPPLINAYMSLSPTMRVFGTAINDESGDVEETGIFLKISEIYQEKKERHISSFRR